MTGPVLAREQYPTLRECVYLNQASLGLIPRATTEAMVRLLQDVAQHGNVRLSDEAEADILDDVRAAGAVVLDAAPHSIAIVGGASEGLGQLAAMLAAPDGEVVLVASDFPSVTYPWLNAQARLGMAVTWADDRPEEELTASLVEAISERTTVVCFSAVQYATGTRVDVAAVVGRAREVGARVIVDVTQLAGAAPVSMRKWGPTHWCPAATSGCRPTAASRSWPSATTCCSRRRRSSDGRARSTPSTSSRRR